MGSISHGTHAGHGFRDTVVRIVALAATLFVTVDAIAAFRATKGGVQHLSALIVAVGALAAFAILVVGLLRKRAAAVQAPVNEVEPAEAAAPVEAAPVAASAPVSGPRIRRTQRLRIAVRPTKPAPAANAATPMAARSAAEFQHQRPVSR